MGMDNGIGNAAPRGYPMWLLAYTRKDGVRGHYLTESRERAMRKAESGERAGWRGWQLYGCDPVELWESAGTAGPRHVGMSK